MEAAYNEGRYLQVAQYYHDDAIVSGGDKMVEGRDALDNYWEDFFRIGGKWNLTIYGSATTIIMSFKGALLWSCNAMVKKIEVQFFFTGPKKEGEWKIAQDIYW